MINSIYFNQGHVCCAGSRLLVEENIHDEFVRKLKRRMKQLRVGNPLDKNTDIGAINSKEQLTKIEKLISLGKKEGGEFFETDIALPRSGNFHRPCFFDGVNSAHVISKTEVFGPVLAITTFRTPDEAIKKANDTEYGLAAGIWSEKGSKIHYVASQLNAGVIWCNTYNKFDAASPFGGFKESDMDVKVDSMPHALRGGEIMKVLKTIKLFSNGEFLELNRDGVTRFIFIALKKSMQGSANHPEKIFVMLSDMLKVLSRNGLLAPPTTRDKFFTALLK